MLTGSVGLTKLGSGTLVLTGVNTYGGVTTVGSGVLAVAGPASLPGYATAGGLSVNAGTTLMLQTGNGWNDGSILTMLSNNAAGLNAGCYLGVDTTNGNLTSAIPYPAAPVGLVKAGPGTLTLTAACAYTGATNVGNGTLAFSGSGTSLPGDDGRHFVEQRSHAGLPSRRRGQFHGHGGRGLHGQLRFYAHRRARHAVTIAGD